MKLELKPNTRSGDVAKLQDALRRRSWNETERQRALKSYRRDGLWSALSPG